MTSSTIGYGFSRASVTKVSLGAGTVSVKIPALNSNVTFDNVPFYGDNPSVNDDIIVGYLEGLKATPIAISIAGGSSLPTSAAEGDIEGVTAGLGLSGGGTTGTVSLAFAPSELSSVTVATDDKVVIADTSDSDNPKHVTAQSLANLASVSPAGSDTQVQFNNSGSFGASSNMVFDGTNLDIAGLKIGGTAVTSNATELNILDGVTATTAEINYLDNDDLTAADLTKLAALTATAAEINYLDNDDLTAADLTKLAAVNSTAAELNILDGVIATAGELNTIADITLGTVTANKAVSADSNSDVSSAGQFTAYSGGADSGIVLGRAYGGYVGLRTAGMAEDSGDEYVLMSDGATTFISGGGGSGNTEGDVYIRAGGNSTTCQIHLDTSENDIYIDGELKTDDPITSTDLISTSSVIQANEFRASDYGPASDSSFTFVSDENLGMYRVGADALGLSANGLKFEVQNTQILWHADLPVVSGYSTLRRKNSNNVVGYDGSSIRYKENVTNFVKSDWEKIYNLQAVRFNWKKEIDEDQNRSWGFIAEDVYAQIPELGVMRVVEGVNDGNPVPDTVNYEQMCVFLVEVVKDLNTRLAALE